MNWAGLWASMLQGTQEVLAVRGQMKVDSPPLHASCHKWTDMRITWNLNWFLWVRENEISDIIWPLLMECVADGPKMVQEKEYRQTANVISGKDKLCLLKSATVWFPLWTLLSLPAGLPSNIFIVLYCIMTASMFPCCILQEGAAAWYTKYKWMFNDCNGKVAVYLLLFC